MKIEHVAIWCMDLEKMRGFYEQYFGAVANQKYSNHHKQFSSYFLTFESGPRLELMHKPLLISPNVGESSSLKGFVHIAMSVGSIEKVNQLTERLRLDGSEIVGEPRWTGDGYYESVVLDPEGNRIEITI
ncbi:MAG: VOC family protein [Runella sp.]